MFDAAHLQPLRDRRVQIAKRLGELSSRAAKIAEETAGLEQEASNIDTTLETLAKVLGVDLVDEDGSKSSSKGVSTKPENAPTMFRMVETILEDNQLWGHDFMEGQAIYEAIRKRWWPDAPRNSVIPSLHRFEKDGRLLKSGTKFGLPSTNEAPGAQTPDASEVEWDSDDPF